MYNAINFLSPGSVHAGYPATAVYDILHAQYVLQLHCFDCSIDVVYTALHCIYIAFWSKVTPSATQYCHKTVLDNHCIFRDPLKETTFVLETAIIINGRVCNTPQRAIFIENRMRKS